MAKRVFSRPAALQQPCHTTH